MLGDQLRAALQFVPNIEEGGENSLPHCAEGDENPAMMSIGMHCRLLGRPGRMRALQRFLDHVQAHDRVWVSRRIDIARHWLVTRPFNADTAFVWE